jgi:transposase-like protein
MQNLLGKSYEKILLSTSINFRGDYRSIADYARSQGVSKQALYRWRHCLRQREVSQSTTKTVFTQVVSASFPSSSLTLAMGDAKLTFTRLPDPQWIAQLLSLSRSA